MKTFEPSPPHRTVRKYYFGDFTLDSRSGRLLRRDQELRLRPKSFAVLSYFVEHRDRLITKDELMKALWGDSFVTDGSLVQCVKDIRRVLDDDLQAIIKTVPRRGYIFRAAVTENGDETSDASVIAIEETHAAAPPFEEMPVLQSEKRAVRASMPTPRGWLWVSVALLVGVIVVAVDFYRSPGVTPPSWPWRPVPLTSYPGIERSPALSQDGSRIAFLWNGEKQDNFDVYVQTIGSSGRPQRLTTDAAEEYSPAWSPDGRTIAFLRRANRTRYELVMIPASGGPEHLVTEVQRSAPGRAALAWTPDGRWIAASHQEPGESRGILYLISLTTGERRRLTQPPSGHSDEFPAFSHDSQNLVFARYGVLNDGSISELYVMPLSEDFVSSGRERRLTTEEGQATRPSWTTDGRQILYTIQSPARGTFRVLTVSPHGRSQPLTLEVEGPNGVEFSFGRHLIYSQATREANIWRAEIPPTGKPPVQPHLLISSTLEDHSAQYSPDGREIAFISSRSGSNEVWVAKATGSDPVQLTFFGGPGVFAPSWSPDGQRLIFHARPKRQATLFSIPAMGGTPAALTADQNGSILPSYSRDGKWIYFVVNHSGPSEIWKIPKEGGSAARVNNANGMMPLESPDGKSLFYAVQEEGIWKIASEGGKPVRVTGPIAHIAAFTVTNKGIYYAAPPESTKQQFIYFFDFSTNLSRPVVRADREIGMSLSLTPDERFLIFTKRDQKGSDLTLIRDFVLPK